MKRAIILLALFLATAAMASALEDKLLEAALATDNPAKAEASMADFRARGGAKSDLYVGIVLHNMANAKPARAEESVKLLKSYWERSGDALALGYYGSAVTLQGSFLSSKGDMMGAAAKVDEGFKLLDKAVALAPSEANLRFLRAENGLGVAEGSPFKRYDIVQADLDALKVSFDAMGPAPRAHWLLLSGRLARAKGKLADAIRLYERTIKAAPDSGYAADARKRLAALEE